MSQGKKIQVSWLTSVMKVSTIGSALGLGIDGGEMRLGVERAHQFQRLAGVDQVVDDQHALAIAHDLGLRGLEHVGFGLRLLVVAFHADRIDHADVQLAR
jgi:hypothetical protein